LWLCAACTGGGEGEDSTTGPTPSPTTGADTGGTGSTGAPGTTAGEDSGDTAEPGDTTFGCDLQPWYPDADEDGYGDLNFPVDACLQPPAHIPQGGDCDDSNPDVHPGVEEVCDMADNDCNGLVDEASPTNTSCQGCALGMSGTHAYYYCGTALAQPEAAAFCQQLAGELVTIDDQAELDFLLTEPLPATPQVIIGLNDVEVEGTFVWPDGSEPSFTVWRKGEPNDANEGEDCVHMALPSGGWNDIPCATAAAFVCEAIGI